MGAPPGGSARRTSRPGGTSYGGSGIGNIGQAGGRNGNHGRRMMGRPRYGGTCPSGFKRPVLLPGNIDPAGAEMGTAGRRTDGGIPPRREGRARPRQP